MSVEQQRIGEKDCCVCVNIFTECDKKHGGWEPQYGGQQYDAEGRPGPGPGPRPHDKKECCVCVNIFAKCKKDDRHYGC